MPDHCAAVTSDEATARRRAASPIYAPVTVTQPAEGDAALPDRAHVGGFVRPLVQPADAFGVLFYPRISYEVTIYPSPQATRADLAGALEDAVAAARRLDRDLAARHPDIPASDRWIAARLPARDVDLAAAAFGAGFRLVSCEAHARVDALQRRLAARPGESPAIATPIPADEDALTEALVALQAYDHPFMGGFPVRDTQRRFMAQHAAAAIARGAPWTSVVRDPEDALAAVLTVTPPAESAWTYADLTIDSAAYLGFAWTAPKRRGEGLMGALIRQAVDGVARQGIEDMTIGFAYHNPLGAPYWMGLGFAPTWATWVHAPGLVEA
ncbi:MAG: hypothetical protein E7A62_02135 [Actinomycetaceae bacterium]|nr:hypothetical protein [Actinomycetaceae bacterium]MDU0969778.1 hypothetical protein [Actinomycetaceae bacterium]